MFDNEKKVRKNISINPLLYDAIKGIAKKQNRSFSNYLEVLLHNHLEALQKGKQKEIK